MLKHLRLFLPVFVLLAACGTDTTQPSALVQTGGPVLELFDPALEVDVLQRSAPLLHNSAAVGVIGRDGGTLSLPEAGFSIEFPPNAVRLPTLISVTALPGTSVGYVFAPHGLTFRKPPVITQELRGTAVFGQPALRATLEGAYLPDLAGLAGLTARVRETRPTMVDVTGWKMQFTVDHFSTYVASTSRRSGYISASGNRIQTGH
ncbi:MAG TPA: hypothetical protein VE871_09190 [Longimicrobium sp.]|nr:hypothetical protein [Longimicrobium sp.]